MRRFPATVCASVAACKIPTLGVCERVQLDEELIGFSVCCATDLLSW